MSSAAYKVIYEDVVGARSRPDGPRLADLAIQSSLRQALADDYGAEARLSPPQVWAIENGILTARASFLISAPTNSGKTLIAILRMFASAIEKRSRHVFVVPLKALAEEKAEEFRALAAGIQKHGGPSIQINVSTGDYQMTNDFFGSPPPSQGEILICTPERLEVILRNPENHAWARLIDTYFIDEFHLLGEKGRGATVEILLTRLLTLCQESSLVGLSATIGGIDSVASWLSAGKLPIRQHVSTYRFPSMHRKVAMTEDKDAFISATAKNLLEVPHTSLLVFVYKKADAEKLAAWLQTQVGSLGLVGFFHAGLSLAERKRIISGFQRRDFRVLITTTSLKMGVNTPATEVIIRETFFHGVGRLKTSDLLQMAGRAGRGDIPGQAWILVEKEEDAQFTEDLAAGRVDELTPQLIKPSRFGGSQPHADAPGSINPLLGIALTEVVARRQATAAEVVEFVNHTFSASKPGRKSPSFQKQLLELERGKLIYPVENSQGLYAATKLGRTVSLTGLSPESGAMFATFLRALISMTVKATEQGQVGTGYLRRLTDLDLLFLAAASFEARDNWLPKPSRTAICEAQGFLESLPVDEKPIINLWRSPDSATFPTRRLLATLKIPIEGEAHVSVEKTFYQLIRTAHMLHRHCQGKQIGDLAAIYGIHNGTFESGLKPTITWVLSCLAQICDSDKAYKLDFLSLKIYELLEDLNLGATLGKLLQLDGIGRKTAEKLVSAGITSIEILGHATQEQLLGCGLTTPQVATVLNFSALRRR